MQFCNRAGNRSPTIIPFNPDFFLTLQNNVRSKGLKSSEKPQKLKNTCNGMNGYFVQLRSYCTSAWCIAICIFIIWQSQKGVLHLMPVRKRRNTTGVIRDPYYGPVQNGPKCANVQIDCRQQLQLLSSRPCNHHHRHC